jgi:hypothetical protein
VSAITSALPGLEGAVEPGGPMDTLLTTLVRRRGQLGLVGALSLLWVALRLAASLMAGVEVAFGRDRARVVAGAGRQLAALGALGAIAHRRVRRDRADVGAAAVAARVRR